MPKTVQKKNSLSSSYNIRLSALIIIILILSLFNVFYFLTKPVVRNVLGAQSTSYDTLTAFWKIFLNDQPNYIDGWIRLAEIEYQNGNLVNAKYAIGRAIQIDPNSLRLIELKQKLGI